MIKFIKPNRQVNRVFIHCSASDNPKHDNVATMDAWHKQRGWSGVGYHYFIRKDGLIEVGRDINKIPAAQGGHNNKTIAICLHGLTKSKFTAAQKSALVGLCQQIDYVYKSRVSFYGHCEVSAKSCPVIDYKKVLNLSSDGHLQGIPSLKKKKVYDSAIDDVSIKEQVNILRLGSKGWEVKALQVRLNELGYFVGKVDGDFGGRTRGAVLALQADNDLISDGVVGSLTREILQTTKSRAVGSERQKSGLQGLAKNGSRIADASIKGAGTGIAVSSAGLMSVASQFSGNFQELKNNVEPIANSFGGLSNMALYALLIIVAFMTWQFIRSGKARIEDHKRGKTS